MPILSNISQHVFKLLLGGVGAYLKGTSGLGIGLLAGAIVDYFLHRPRSGKKSLKAKVSSKDQSKDFIASTLLLAAAVVKSDQEFNDLELGYLRRFLSEQFGESKSIEYLALLRASIQADFDIEQTCANIVASNQYETRLQILYIIVGIANADFCMQQEEIDKIKLIAQRLEIDKYDFQSVLAMHQDELTAAYQILELRPSAADAEVRKNYQTLALKYHPDKLSHLGSLAANTAQLKYQKVQQAYETIKKERGFK